MILDQKKLPGPGEGASRTGRSLTRACRSWFRAGAALVIVALLGACGETESAALEPEPAPAASPAAGDGFATPPSASPSAGAAAADRPVRADGTPLPEDPTAEALRRLRDPDRFRGAGSLRGALYLPGGEAAPRRWTLKLSPSRTLAGREHAVERAVEITGGATEFTVEDVPFGGYDVRAYTDGYASRPTSVSIEKTASSPYVTFALEPLGTVRGVLQDEDGRAVEGVTVHLRLRRTGELTTTESRADGAWFFEGVETGAWTLIVGRVDAPEVPPKDFDNTGARSSNLGALTLPVRGSLRVNVADESGAPLAGVEVVGYSDGGANVSGVTDADGWFDAGRIPFGSWKFLARDGEGRRVREVLEVEDGEPATLYMTLPPR